MKSKLPFISLSFIVLGSQIIHAAAFVPVKKTGSLLAVNLHQPVNGTSHPVAYYPDPQIRPKKSPEPQMKSNQQQNKKKFPGQDWKQQQNKKAFPGDDWRKKNNNPKQSVRSHPEGTNKVSPKGFMPETFKKGIDQKGKGTVSPKGFEPDLIKPKSN